PAPAADGVAAGDDRLVADPDRTQHLVPPRRSREVAFGGVAQAVGGGRPARQLAHRGEVGAGGLELPRPAGAAAGGVFPRADARAEVVFGGAAERDQRLGVAERPAPAVEADDALQQGDRLALDRLAVQGRIAELGESLSAPAAFSRGRHETSLRSVSFAAYP